MALTKNAAQPTPVAKAPDVIELTMAEYKKSPGRYVYKNALYEKGIVYEVTSAVAKELFGLTTDKGIPVFIRYREKPAPVLTTDGKQRVKIDAKSASTVATPSATVDLASVKPTTVEVGDPGEIEELIKQGIIQADDVKETGGDASVSDLQQGGMKQVISI